MQASTSESPTKSRSARARRPAEVDDFTMPVHRRPMPTPDDRALEGLTVLAFESRRASEMEALIRRFGGVPLSAPALREVPLETSPQAEDFLRRLDAGAIDVVILLTGVGTRALVATQAARYDGGGA